MAFDAFLLINGIQGESNGGTIELDSFSFGVENTSTVGSGTGGGAGKTSLSDLHFTAKVGSQSPQLLESALNGKILENAQLTVSDKYSASGAPNGSYLTIKFSDVTISSYKLAEGPASLKLDDIGGVKIDALLPAVQKNAPTEFVSFSFSQINFQTQGSTGNGNTTGWNIVTNKAS